MTTEHVLTSIDDGILTISINRITAKNALSLQMYQALVDALKELDDNPNLSVGIITGGETCFTAGNDLNDFLSGGELNSAHPTVQFIHQIANTKKTLIAAVAGPAIGIGSTMLLHCDLVYAADNSVFQLPFVKLGLCPEAGCSDILPKLMGHVNAFELVVLGEKFTADKALTLGLINKVCPVEQVFSIALESAINIRNLPSKAVITSKALLKNSNQKRIADTINIELEYFEMLLNDTQSQQIISSILNK